MGQAGICLFGIAVDASRAWSVDDDWDTVSIFKGGGIDGVAVEEERWGGSGRVNAMVAIGNRAFVPPTRAYCLNGTGVVKLEQ